MSAPIRCRAAEIGSLKNSVNFCSFYLSFSTNIGTIKYIRPYKNASEGYYIIFLSENIEVGEYICKNAVYRLTDAKANCAVSTKDFSSYIMGRRLYIKPKFR